MDASDQGWASDGERERETQQSHCQVQFHFNFRLDTDGNSHTITVTKKPQFLKIQLFFLKFHLVFVLSFYSVFLDEKWWANIILSLPFSRSLFLFVRVFFRSFCCWAFVIYLVRYILCALREEMSCGDLNKVHFELHIHILRLLRWRKRPLEQWEFEIARTWNVSVVHITISIMSDFTLCSFLC